MDVRIDDCPGERSLKVGLNVRELQSESQFCFRFYVVLYQISQPHILATALEVASSLPVEEILVESGTVTPFPPKPDFFEDCFELRRILRRGGRCLGAA